MHLPRFNILKSWRMAVVACGVLLAISALLSFLIYQHIVMIPSRPIVFSHEERPPSFSQSFSPALIDDIKVFFEKRILTIL